MFNDTQIKEEAFLEDISNLLNSGEVPNLFEKEEMATIYDTIRQSARDAGLDDAPDGLWNFFISNVRKN